MPEGGASASSYCRSRHRRSASPLPPPSRRASLTGLLLSPGYEQYQKSLLEVPWSADYGEASSDDLSSEWDSDVPDQPPQVKHHSYVTGRRAVSRDDEPGSCGGVF
uniref:Uncharacterized protein n=1 Tax=Timema tahoe TaxID=61484 RepID=A0A7R9FJX7_9NEOP|nr:unnamed protein product [Timema tahoe]